MNKPSIPVVRTVAELHARVDDWRAEGRIVGLVPTMGSLHAGHLSLVDLAGKDCDRVVVSIFVNPAQFAAHEDLGTYPRDEIGDRMKLAAHGVHLVYAPGADQMYPDGFSTRVEVLGLSTGLCGTSRPHFFAGVATVVAKLFLQCRPDVAVFGEKDYQQLLVIRRMARDLDLPIEVLGAPIVREPDGLAMSSRNAYLSEADRETAPQLHRVITDAAKDMADGRTIEDALKSARDRLKEAGFTVDYLEVRHADTLVRLETLENTPARLFAAVLLGETRLIDNIVVPETPR